MSCMRGSITTINLTEEFVIPMADSEEDISDTDHEQLSGGSRKSLRVVLLVGEAHLPRSGLQRRSLGGHAPPRNFFGNMDALRCNLVHS